MEQVREEVLKMRHSLNNITSGIDFNIADHEQRQIVQAVLTIADNLDLIAEVVAD